MTEVNKNIIDAYKSMYEPKEEVLDETNKNDKSDDGEGLDAVQPDAVKKKFKDRKDKDIDNDGDVDSSDEYLHKKRKAVSKAIKKESQNGFKMAAKKAKDNGDDEFVFAGKKYDVQSVYKESFDLDDIRAMCHSKDHDCATYVDHPEFGLGKPVYESHAIPDEDGHVAWYDVEFAHGIEEQVPVEDMQILQTEAHTTKSSKHKDKEKVIKGSAMKRFSTPSGKLEDTVINVDNDEEEAPQVDSDEKPMKKKKPPMPPKKDNGEEGDDVEEPEDDGKDVKIISKDKKKKNGNGNGNGNGKTAEISKIGEEVSEFTTLINELMAVDAVGKKKKEKDGSEPEEKGETASDGEKEFTDAHGKKDVAVDVDDAIKQTTKTAQDTKKGKHVKGQTAKGDTNIIKSTEAPVKDKEVKDGEGKKSVTKESTLMDLAVQALKGKTVPEMRNIIASQEKEKNPFDARTRDAKAFLERMHKRKNGNGGQYKDKDPKDLPMIKSGYGKGKKGDK